MPKATQLIFYLTRLKGPHTYKENWKLYSISLRKISTLDVAYETLQTILDFYAKFVKKRFVNKVENIYIDFQFFYWFQMLCQF